MNREKLFNKAFEKKEIVCSHIFNTSTEYNALTVLPLCVEIFEDGYEVFWYCSKCVEIYHLSSLGTFVFDAGENLEKEIAKLKGVKVGDDPDLNPYSKFLEEQKGFLLTRSELMKFNVPYTVDNFSETKQLLRVPFGAEVNVKYHE